MRTALSIVLALNVAGSLSAEEDWRQFRGPTGEGHSGANRLPLNWDENHKVVWKTAIHDHGWSSPVVYAQRFEDLARGAASVPTPSFKAMWSVPQAGRCSWKKR